MSYRDLPLSSLRRSEVSHTAFKIINLLQDEPLDYAVAALGLTLNAVATEKNLSPGEIMTAANNMLHAEGLSDDNYVSALRNFIKDELP
jgi:hypothetical protein